MLAAADTAVPWGREPGHRPALRDGGRRWGQTPPRLALEQPLSKCPCASVLEPALNYLYCDPFNKPWGSGIALKKCRPEGSGWRRDPPTVTERYRTRSPPAVFLGQTSRFPFPSQTLPLPEPWATLGGAPGSGPQAPRGQGQLGHQGGGLGSPDAALAGEASGRRRQY